MIGDQMTLKLPEGLDTLLTRAQLAPALNELGYPTSVATLATQATRGGGPPFSKWGPRVVYRWGDALAWARERLSAPRHSTSEPLIHNVP